MALADFMTRFSLRAIVTAIWSNNYVAEADRTVTVANGVIDEVVDVTGTIPSVIDEVDHYVATANFDGSGIANVTVTDIGTAAKALLVFNTNLNTVSSAYINSTTTVRIVAPALASNSATVAFDIVKWN
jgi:hypothetical protein